MSEIWNHIARYFDRGKTSETEGENDHVINNNGQYIQNLSDTAESLKKIDLYFQLKSVNTSEAWEKISPQIKDRGPYRIITIGKVLRVAAFALLLLSTGFLAREVLMKKTRSIQTAQNDFSHPTFILPDGSKVILNHGSSISYPRKFNASTREVVLKGEAFFEVVPNAEARFEVKTKNAVVRVLGTSFNVMAYDSNETVQVYVKTGKVEVSDDQLADHHQLTLLPGDLLTINTKTNIFDQSKLHNQNPLAWFTKDLSFEFSSLGEVIETLEHVYNLRIETAPGVNLSQKITASFNRQNPDYIVEVVTLALNLRFTITENGSYFIHNEKE